MSPSQGPIAMILAAGFGTRLAPLTQAIPKALAPVAGRPMIHYPLGWLREQGITNVVINLHHLGDRIESALGDGSEWGLRITYSHEDEILGTGAGVARARRIFGRRRLILINADTLIDAKTFPMMYLHESAQAVATLAVCRPPDPANYTELLVDRNELVRTIGGRPRAAARTGCEPFTYTGLAVLEPELIDYLPDDRFAHLAADGLIPALREGRPVAAYEHTGYWKALDNRERIGQAEEDISLGKLKLPALDKI